MTPLCVKNRFELGFFSDWQPHCVRHSILTDLTCQVAKPKLYHDKTKFTL